MHAHEEDAEREDPFQRTPIQEARQEEPDQYTQYKRRCPVSDNLEVDSAMPVVRVNRPCRCDDDRGERCSNGDVRDQIGLYAKIWKNQQQCWHNDESPANSEQSCDKAGGQTCRHQDTYHLGNV